MSRRLINKNRERVAQEEGTCFHSWNEGRYRVALIYPNTYSQGMSNLGFQTVYHLINKRHDCLCERFFYPDKTDLKEYKRTAAPFLSMESERPLKDFDLIALSLSFENDYLNLPVIFELGLVPLFAAERNEKHPLVLLGGVCAFINPEPLADIVDVVAVGEAEPILPTLINTLVQGAQNRQDLLKDLSSAPGIYIPGYYTPEYDKSGLFCGYRHENHVPAKVKRVFAEDLDQTISRNFIVTSESGFKDMALTEVSRGCSRKCRFCAAGYIYLPFRERSLDNLMSQVEIGMSRQERIGLVAAAVADYSEIERLQAGIIAKNGKISMSSIRLDALTALEVSHLKQADHRTVAIAPEAGSQRLRDAVNKGISEEQILHAVGLLAEGGIKNIKLYFIIGFPLEEWEDVEAIISLVTHIGRIWRSAGQKAGSVGQITLSINPFIPKPFTPFQWAAMDMEKSLKKKYRYLQGAVSQLPNTRMISESIKMSRLQTFLSRGDRRIGQLLSELSAGTNLKQLCNKHDIDLESYVTAEQDEYHCFPWEVIDQGVTREYLWQEYMNARKGITTPPCAPDCRRCGVCGE